MAKINEIIIAKNKNWLLNASNLKIFWEPQGETRIRGRYESKKPNYIKIRSWINTISIISRLEGVWRSDLSLTNGRCIWWRYGETEEKSQSSHIYEWVSAEDKQLEQRRQSRKGSQQSKTLRRLLVIIYFLDFTQICISKFSWMLVIGTYCRARFLHWQAFWYNATDFLYGQSAHFFEHRSNCLKNCSF